MDPSWPPPQADLPARRNGQVPVDSTAAVARDALVVVGALTLLGVAAGAVWERVVDPPLLIRFDQSVGQDELQLSHAFAVDGWYVVVAALAGLLAGFALALWRRRDLLATVVLLVVGSLVAAVVMGEVGHLLGPDDPTARLLDADVAATAPAPLEVGAAACYLVWPVAVLVGALLPLLVRRRRR